MKVTGVLAIRVITYIRDAQIDAVPNKVHCWLLFSIVISTIYFSVPE